METINQLLSNDIGYIQALRFAQPLPKPVFAAPVTLTKPIKKQSVLPPILAIGATFLFIWLVLQTKPKPDKNKNENTANKYS